jgi:hypothetical protein
MIEIVVVYSALYAVFLVLVGWMIGIAGEDVFNFDWRAGAFLWPLVLCGLIVYGIFCLIKAIVKTILRR